MARKAFILFSLFAFLNYSSGCTTSSITTVPREGISALQGDSVSEYPRKIVRTNLVNGGVIVYNDEGGRYRPKHKEQDSVVVGVTDDGAIVVVPLRDVKSVIVKERAPDSAASNSAMLTGAGILAFALLFAYAFAQGLRGIGDQDH